MKHHEKKLVEYLRNVLVKLRRHFQRVIDYRGIILLFYNIMLFFHIQIHFYYIYFSPEYINEYKDYTILFMKMFMNILGMFC